MNRNEELIIKPIKTSIFSSGLNLIDFICHHIKEIGSLENSILCVTSKIVSISENRTVSKTRINKIDLIKQEAEYYLAKTNFNCHLTINCGILIASSGIDESNSEKDEYILYPKDPFESAESICLQLKQRLGVHNLGVIITDSHTTPLRAGVTGIGIAYCGFQGVKDLRGSLDLFDKTLNITRINIVDALSAAATLMMGEGNERKPLAIIFNAKVTFQEKINKNELLIPIEDDLYSPLIKLI